MNNFISILFSGGKDHPVDSMATALDKVESNADDKKSLDNEISKADLQYQLEVSRLNLEADKLSAADRDSARANQAYIQTNVNATLLSKNISSYLAIAATILCFALFYVLVFKPQLMASTDRQILTYILGVLSATLSQVFSYYFGSSTGSADKSRTLSNILESKNT
jgi:hypothetical protein